MQSPSIRCVSCARIPILDMQFELCIYRTSQDNKEHLVLKVGDPTRPDVLVRVHSECFTGDVLGSLRCDCGPQLREAMQSIARHGHGVIVYLRQEGRGIGLAEKLKAYNLQDEGYDTVDANLLLGHQADARDYSIAALLLEEVGVRDLRLLTNNPAKVEGLEATGLRVRERIPLQIEVHEENETYLATKARRMRHLLDLGSHASERPCSDAMRTPRVTLSYAQSLDGSITARRGEALALSGPDAVVMTHRVRASHDAILVGIGTVLSDDPQLTVRKAPGDHPQPIVLDSALRFPSNARLLTHPSHRPWIVTTPRAEIAKERKLEQYGAQVIRVPAGRDGRIDLDAVLAELGHRGISSVMVEGGAAVITSFLAAQLVDQVVITVAPIYVGGLNAVQDLVWLNGRLRPTLRNATYRRMGRDFVLMGQVVAEEAAG